MTYDGKLFSGPARHDRSARRFPRDDEGVRSLPRPEAVQDGGRRNEDGDDAEADWRRPGEVVARGQDVGCRECWEKGAESRWSKGAADGKANGKRIAEPLRPQWQTHSRAIATAMRNRWQPMPRRESIGRADFDLTEGVLCGKRKSAGLPAKLTRPTELKRRRNLTTVPRLFKSVGQNNFKGTCPIAQVGNRVLPSGPAGSEDDGGGSPITKADLMRVGRRSLP